MITVQEICNEHHITDGEIKVGCNNLEAIRRLSDTDYLVSPNHAHFDITTAIHHYVKQSLITWKTRHAWGHQDDNPFSSLDRWAKLNVEVDALAKAYLQVITKETGVHRQQRINGEGWSVWTGRQKITL